MTLGTEVAWPGRLRWAVAVPAGAAGLLLPALWNGYPLFYYDSLDYLRLPFGAELPVFRTAAYGLFTGVGRLADTLWAVVATQAALTAAALWLVAAALGPTGRSVQTYLLLLLAAVLGGLPWYASQIMADTFTGVTILGMLTLLLAADRLDGPGRTALAAVTAVATALHTSHLGLAVGLLLLGVIARAAHRVRPGLPPVGLALPAASVGVALALAVGANAAVTGRPFLTQPAAVQTLGLFVENGLAKRYLDVTCPRRDPPPYQLCAFRDALPRTANAFLWGPGPFEALGEFAGMEAEAEAIVAGTVRMFPGGLAWQTVRLTAQQFLMVNLGDGLLPLQFMMREPIADHYPGDVAAYDAARQQRGAIHFEPIRPIELPLHIGALLLLGLLAAREAFKSDGDRTGVLLATGLILGLLGNAFICGALSNPNHRYQGRIAWLPLAAVFVLAYRQRSPAMAVSLDRVRP